MTKTRKSADQKTENLRKDTTKVFSRNRRRERISSGINLVTFGLIALLVNFEFTTWNNLFSFFITYWPLFIVAAGVKLVLRSFSFGNTISILFEVLFSIGILVAITSPVLGDITFKIQNTQQELYGPEKKSTELNKEAESIEYEINIGATAYYLADDSETNALFADSKNGPITISSDFDKKRQHQTIKFYNDSKGAYVINPFTTSNRYYKLNTNSKIDASYLIKTGATEGTINISNTKVSAFDINLGAGSADITFSEKSTPKEMDINLGAGDITVSIPESYSIELDYTLGMGDITVNSKSFGGIAGDNSYTHKGTGENMIEITVQVGAGSVSINSY